MSERQEKVSREIQRLAAEFIQHQSNKSSMITATRADVSKDLSNARVYVSVFPEDKEDEALGFLKRNESEAREFVKKHGFFKRAPHISFVLDRGEKNRQALEVNIGV